MPKPITLFIVDDHQMLIDGIKALLMNEDQFEIIGEALSQMSKLDPALAKRVSDYQKIISFRNILIRKRPRKAQLQESSVPC